MPTLSLGDLHFDPPQLGLEELARIAGTLFGLEGELRLLPGERDQNALLATPVAHQYVLKVSGSGAHPDSLDFQLRALRHIERVTPDLPVPRVFAGRNGADLQHWDCSGTIHRVRMLSYLPGRRYQDGPRPGIRGLMAIGRFQAELDRALRGFFHPGARQFMPWDLRNRLVTSAQMVGLLSPAVEALTRELRQSLEAEVLPALDSLRAQVIHHDGHGANLLRPDKQDDAEDQDEAESIAGIIDFGDMIHGPLICDLATGLADFIGEADSLLDGTQAIVRGFHGVTPLLNEECDLLYDLVAGRWLLTVELFEFRRREMAHPPDFVRDDQPGIVRDLERLLAIGREAFSRAVREACGLLTPPRPMAGGDAALIRRRQRVMAPGYQLFYQRPVHLIRGEGVWLFDVDGRRYLDCYNNVASVGHCHPHVVRALARQAATLNTHTRYLHENVVHYAERLGATLPAGLDVCLFVCTGTEANDLAFRMARVASGNDGAIVMDDSYHGNSMVVTELSTAEYPEEGRPDWLATVEAPNGCRGSIAYGEPDAGPRYARMLGEAVVNLAARGHRPAMFLVDPIFDSNGAFTAPPGYLAEAFARVRAAGALCVADEVQSGLCRLGDHWWGFEDSGVVPDIVTMGKPIGDGHPLAAVVTTRKVAEAFSRKFGYFNTFGGNPVSAAVGCAVLEVIEQEDVLGNVHRVGKRLGSGLRQLAARHAEIGDVRGKGLFWGLDIVRDPASRAPNREGAARIREAMRENGVLVGTSGPYGNVVKIRPPLIFSTEHCDLLLDRLERAIMAARSLAPPAAQSG